MNLPQETAPSHTCNICSKTFKIQSEFDDHKLSHLVHKYDLNSKSWTCSCGLIFHNKFHLLVHQKEHALQTKLHYCPLLCGRFFTSLSDMERHQEEHVLGEQNFKKRTYSDDSFDVSYNMYKTDSGVDLKQTEVMSSSCDYDSFVSDVHICNFCGETFETKLLFERHKEMHLMAGQHSCKLCDKSFKSVGSLKHHLNIHTKQSYKCFLCPKAFIQKKLLGIHLNVHAVKTDVVGGSQRYHCAVCDSETVGKRLLQHHFMHIYQFKFGFKGFEKVPHRSKKESQYKKRAARRKTVARNWKESQHVVGDCVCVGKVCKCYMCSLCKRNFTAIDLMLHLKLHMGQLVQCEKCEKVFSSNSQFINHIKGTCTPYGWDVATT